MHDPGTPLPALTQVRFRFFGKGHDQPLTGHLYLRWIAEQNIWRMSDWQRSDTEFKNRKQIEGDDPIRAGSIYLELIGTFLENWQRRQQEAVDRQHKVTRSWKPNEPISRPGFRAIPASKHWHQYRGAVLRECAAIRDDVTEALLKLRTGWIKPEAGLTYPTITVAENPWA